MSQELAKPQMCVLTKQGLEFWIDADRVEEFHKTLNDTTQRLIKIKGQLINPFEVVGVFTPDAMEDRQRRKNGQWKCLLGTWHEKGQGCGCQRHKEMITAFVDGVGEVKYKR